MLSTRYLLLYNAAMAAGWSFVLARLVAAVAGARDVYAAVATPLQIFQTGALLEIVHAASGLVRAPAATTALQVGSRLMLVWGVADAVGAVRANLSFVTMVLAWSLTEIPRYFYFTVVAASSTVPYWVTFLRYSTFLPLYPMGASSEWFTLYAALPHIKSDGLFSVSLPNRFNFAFDYYTYCIFILAMYIPGLPYMYSHMLRQRRKYVVEPRIKLDKAE